MQEQLYREIQHFRGNPLWMTLLGLPLLFFLAVLLYQVFTGETFGDRPVNNLSLVLLVALVFIPSAWAFFRVKLTLVIEDAGIRYGWNMPTDDLNYIPFSEVASLSVIRYEFVGYGYRISERYGSVHNLSGHWGLQIIRKDGEKVLIGTQNPDALTAAVKNTRLPQSI